MITTSYTGTVEAANHNIIHKFQRRLLGSYEKTMKSEKNLEKNRVTKIRIHHSRKKNEVAQ